MTVFQAIILGLVQGLAEFLPISSSAHLSLTPYLFGWTSPGLAFDVSLHIGTLAAVIWYFRREWAALFRAGFALLGNGMRPRDDAQRRVVFLIVATIPAAVAGVLLEDLAETVFRHPALTAVMLIVAGVLLWAADRFSRHDRPLGEMRWTDALIIGLAQCCALVPGVSRSGSTMIAGRFRRFSRPDAAVFSFLMSMPITAAAIAVKTPQAIAESAGNYAPLIAGIIASGVSGWLAIAVLLRYLARNSFGVFAVYRVALGFLVLWLVYTRGA
jgi:undecaprenyl-diphosphatase